MTRFTTLEALYRVTVSQNVPFGTADKALRCLWTQLSLVCPVTYAPTPIALNFVSFIFSLHSHRLRHAGL